MTAALLEVSNLTKYYALRNGRPFSQRRILKAVDGVSFSLQPGRTLGIIGESGCGKSTTAGLIMGVLAATSGDVMFEGKPMRARFDRAWRQQRRHIQMVYQNPLGALDRRLPVGAQVMEPLTIHGMGARAERRERGAELFEAVGLRSDLWDRFPHELSGGQRQRVVIARALILEPSLIVCDEPVSALDVSVAAQIVNLLEDIQTRLGVAYVFISHDLKIVRHIAHEVAVMYLGRVVEQGPPDLVFRTPAHPYTNALVSAVPSAHRRTVERVLLSGDPPNPLDAPSGCTFHTRCPIAQGVCAFESPALRPAPDGRQVACHFAGTVAETPVAALGGA